jgi:hypothetical protein
VARESYCPQCFARIPVDAEICSVCGVDISALSERDYNEKLVHALHHPLSDIRLRAIIALGLQGDDGAARALVECALRHASDVVEGLEVVNSLRQIRSATIRRQALKELTERHPTHGVQMSAKDACRDRGENPSQDD